MPQLDISGSTTAPAPPNQPFDPFVAGGLIKNKDGTYSSPVAPPTPQQAAPPAAQPRPAPMPAGEPFDPFVAGGLTRLPSGDYQSPLGPKTLPDKPNPPSRGAVTSGTTAAFQPWYQMLWDGLKDAQGASDAALDWASHKMTFGFDNVVSPIPAAVYRSLVRGIPFTDAYTQIQHEHDAQLTADTEQHPIASWIGTGLGVAGSLGGGIREAPGIGPPLFPGSNINTWGYTGQGRPGLMGLFGTAGRDATLGERAAMFGRNVAAGAGLGALGGLGETEGDLGQRLEGARRGAEWGAALQAGFGAAGAALKGVFSSLAPYRPAFMGGRAARQAMVRQKAGEILEEMTPGGSTGPQPPFQQAPVEGFPLGVGGATNEPGLAALERLTPNLPEGQLPASNLRLGQQAALLREATTPTPLGQLASGEMDPAQASGYIADALRSTWQIYKSFERRLWTNPAFTTNLDMMHLQQGVQRFRDSLELRFRNEINRHPGFSAILDRLRDMPAGATLADVNDMVASELKVLGRTDDDPEVRMLAGRFAGALDRLIERNPELVAAGPAAQAAYQSARNFTRQMWQTIGQEPFQRIIRPGSDVRGAGSSLFAFTPQRAGERLPQGVAQVIDGLNWMRQQYTAAGQGALGAASAAAASGLRQRMIDFIISAAIAPIRQMAKPGGVRPGDLNALQYWIQRNRGWLINSRLFTGNQIDMLDRIAQASQMGARSLYLRGGTGSETYERFMAQHPKIVDIFASPLTRMGASALGAYIGKLLGEYGEAGIGMLLGLETGGLAAGHVFLQRLYSLPAQELRQLLAEASQSAPIAEDLMQNMRGARIRNNETIQWIRAIAARLGGEFGAASVNYGLGGRYRPSTPETTALPSR